MPRPVDRRTVNGLQRRNRGAIAVGLLLALGGGLYGVWGAGEFRSGLTTEIRESRTLSTRDPVARLGLLFAPYQERLGELEPETETERILLRELDGQTRLAAQLLVLLVRVLFASLVMTVGMILFSSGWSQQRALALVDGWLDRRPPANPSEP